MQGSSFAAMALVLAPLTGCAGGNAGGESPPPMIGGTSNGAESEESRGEEEESSGSGTESTSDATSTTTPIQDTTSGDSGESGSSGASESSGGGESCSNMLSCNSATVLGTVSGDENSRQLHASGSDPTWLTFRVTENNDGLGGESVSFTATLTSPVGHDFDIFAFRGPDNGMSGCGGVMDESTGAGVLDLVSMSWGEGGVANGGDESAWVAVQIEPKSGTCDPTAQWMLDVEGDT